MESSQEAYESGYADGVFMAEQMRWQGTPIGDFLKGPAYRPAQNHRATYDAGFKRAMQDASRGNWSPPLRDY